MASIAQSAERQSFDLRFPCSNPGQGKHSFHHFLLFFFTWKSVISIHLFLLYVKMSVLYENVINFIIFKESSF